MYLRFPKVKKYDSVLIGEGFKNAPLSQSRMRAFHAHESKLGKRKRRLFAVEYIKDFNPSQALLRANLGFKEQRNKSVGVNSLDFDRRRIVPNKMVMMCQKEIREELENMKSRFKEKKIRVPFTDVSIAKNAEHSPLNFTEKEFKKEIETRRLNADEVIQEIAKIAFQDIKDSSNKNNKSLYVTTAEKLKALDMLAKHFGVYEIDNKQKAAQNQILQVMWLGDTEHEALKPQRIGKVKKGEGANIVFYESNAPKEESEEVKILK